MKAINLRFIILQQIYCLDCVVNVSLVYCIDKAEILRITYFCISLPDFTIQKVRLLLVAGNVKIGAHHCLKPIIGMCVLNQDVHENMTSPVSSQLLIYPNQCNSRMTSFNLKCTCIHKIAQYVLISSLKCVAKGSVSVLLCVKYG